MIAVCIIFHIHFPWLRNHSVSLLLYFSCILIFHRHGIVQPCRVSDDGKPVPVEHVLEMLEGQGGAEGGETVNSDED